MVISMNKNRLLVLSKDEHELLKGLIPVLIKDTDKKIKEDKNIINKKALSISVDILKNLDKKLKVIKF